MTLFDILPHEHQLEDYADALRLIIFTLKRQGLGIVLSDAVESAEHVEKLLLAIARELKS